MLEGFSTSIAYLLQLRTRRKKEQKLLCYSQAYSIRGNLFCRYKLNAPSALRIACQISKTVLGLLAISLRRIYNSF